jgi:type I restriction enzyme S subunit
MEVRPGYKRTEVGVLPEDWDVSGLDALAVKVGSGITPTGGQGVYKDDGRPFVRSQNVGWGLLLLDDVAFIDDSTHATFPGTELRSGDVLLNITGASIGRSAIADARLEGGNVNQHVCIIRTDTRTLVPKYLNLYLLSSGGQRQIDSFQAGGNRQGLNFGQVRSMRLPLPPTTVEQRAIATALSDVDALLEGLTRLIAKKRDLKQAAMQQLLTGQIRLPGFHGEWEVKRLGDHVTFLRNGVNSRAELTEEGPVKYLHYGDVHACKGTTLVPAALPSLPSSKASSLDRLKDGDLILADASEDLIGVSKSVEIRGVGTGEVVSGLHTIAARFEKDVLADGFKAYLQFCPPFAGHLRRLAAGTKVYATNRAHVASVEMPLPAVDEQSAIAAVLSDMDAELSALEARRDKTRALKRAMMQELLTGRTRLV